MFKVGVKSMQTSRKKPLLYFLVGTFLLTYGVGLLIYLSGGLTKHPLLSSLIMIIPTLVAIITMLITEPWNGFTNFAESLGFRLGKKRYLIIYPLLTCIIVIFIYLITYLMFPNVFIPREKLPEILATLNLEFGGIPTWTLVLMIFLLNNVMGSITGLPLFLGEEIGWRAFLYPRLKKRYQAFALLIGGIIWGLWHAPMILMGHNYPGTPFLGVFMMVLFCIPMGVIFYYFYKKSKSIITVALCHGVLNNTASMIHVIFIDGVKIQPTIHGATGVIGLMIFWIIAFFIYRFMSSTLLHY